MSTPRTKSQSTKSLVLPGVGISVDKSPAKRDLAPKNGGCQLSRREKVDEEAKKLRPTVLGNMDAIVCGVEAWFEENTGYSRRVTETTVEVARALGMPEDEIEKWEYSRSIHVAEKVRVIKSLLERLQDTFCCADNRGQRER